MQEFFQNVFQNVSKLVLSMRWNDILDIVIITFALYFVIKLFRQTRAIHLIKGIVSLVLVYLIVSALNLSTSTYIFSRLFSDIVIVLILLFQPEIRHAIETFGRGGFSKFSPIFKPSQVDKEKIHASILEVTKACTKMSEDKVGALIVFEGKSPLGEVIASGSNVDAQISSAVIENIFYPKAPLHDGAMIIRENRINSAGCILPLTENEISRELGTRHRAALGMSEKSDALIVVVSEETGAISIAQDSVLTRNVTQVELLERLTKFLVLEEDEPKIRRRRKKDEE